MGSSCSNQKPQPVIAPKVVRPRRETGASLEDRELEENAEYSETRNVSVNKQMVKKTAKQQEKDGPEEEQELEREEEEEEVEEGEEEVGEEEEGEEEEVEEGEEEEEEGEEGEDEEGEEGEYDDGEEDEYYDEEGDEYEERTGSYIASSTYKTQSSIPSDANLPDTIYGDREDHDYVLRNPFMKKRRNYRLVRELYTVPLVPQSQLYKSPYGRKKSLDRPDEEIMNESFDENGEVIVKKPPPPVVSNYSIEQIILILKFSIIYEIQNSSDEVFNLFLFDEGLHPKDLLYFNMLFPRTPFGCPKVYKKGVFDLPGYDTRYHMITEPLSLSLGDLLTYHYQNNMVFREDEIIRVFIDVASAVLSVYQQIDLHYITDYDIYLDKEGDRFVITPFTLNRRFEDITQNYTYDEIMNGCVDLDPHTSALIEVLPPEILRAWKEKARFDICGARETSIVYCLGIIVYKLATQRYRISLKDKESFDRFATDLKSSYQVIPTLIKHTLGLDPKTRKPLKFLVESLKSHKFQIPPQTTYKIKLNKIKNSEWAISQKNFRSEGKEIDAIMNDLLLGKGYVLALRIMDQGCSLFDQCYENLVALPDVDTNLKAKYIEVLFYLSICMREQARFDDAYEYINEARLLCEYIYPQKHIMTARVLCEMATIFKQKDEEQESIEPYTKAIEIFNSFGDIGRKYTLATISLLTEVRITCKDFATARKDLMQMIKSNKYAEKQIGELYFYLSKVLEAEHLFEDAIDSLEKAIYFFEESFSTKEEFFKKILKSLVRIAMTIKLDDKVEMLKKHYKDKVPLFITEVKIEVTNILEQQGAAYKVHEDYKQAVEIYQRVAKFKLDIYGRKHPNYVNCREIIANLFEYDGKFEKALSQYKDIKRFKEMLYGENSLRVINTLISMGKCCEELRRYGDALKVYAETGRIQAEKLGETHKEYLKTLERIKSVRAKLAQGTKRK